MRISNFKFSIFKKQSSSQKGFTLIELLVTIGILGVLASALVATIDPFEQLKKAQDANIKNAAVEFNTALVRTYTTHSSMPWVWDAGCGSASGGVGSTNGPTGNSVVLNSITNCLTALVADGEIKSAFTTATSVLTNIYVRGDATSATACFIPVSKSQQRDPNTKFTTNGSTTTSGVCVGGSNCAWCTQ